MQRLDQRTNLILIVSSLILALGVGILIPLAMGEQFSFSGGDARTPPPPTPVASLTTTNLSAQRPVAMAARSATWTDESSPTHTAAAADRPTVFVPSPTALPGARPSPAPTATPSPTPVAVISATPTATGAQSPAHTPTATVTPVPTIERSPAPTPAQSLTPTQPSVTAAALPSPRAPSQAVPLLPPVLEAPAAGAMMNVPLTFVWQAAQPLPAGAAYEVVAWETGQAPSSARGLAAPTTDTSLQIDLAVPYGLGVFKTTDLFWTVLIVQTSPYKRLTQPDSSPARTLR